MQPREIFSAQIEEGKIHLCSAVNYNIIGATLTFTELANKPFKTFTIIPPAKGKFGIIAIVVEFIEHWKNSHQGFFIQISNKDKGVFADLKNFWHPLGARKIWFRNGHLYAEIENRIFTTSQAEAEMHDYFWSYGNTICHYAIMEYNAAQVEGLILTETKKQKIKALSNCLEQKKKELDQLRGDKKNLENAVHEICKRAGVLLSALQTGNRFRRWLNKRIYTKKVKKAIPELERVIGT